METKINKSAREGLIPFASHLLQPIKRLPQPQDILPLSLVPQWRLHVNLLVFIKLAIEISTYEIEHINLPIKAHGEHENSTKAGKPCYQREGVIIVLAEDLSEAVSDEPRLVFLHLTLRVLLDA